LKLAAAAIAAARQLGKTPAASVDRESADWEMAGAISR
jgi:hypothetical protein